MSVTHELLDWRFLVAVVVLVGVMPGVVLRQVVRIYPKGHPRRAELLAELYVRPYVEQMLFVAQSLEISIAEGVPVRWRNRRRARANEPELAREPRREEADGVELVDLVLTTDLPNPLGPRRSGAPASSGLLPTPPSDVQVPPVTTVVRHLRALLVGLILGSVSRLALGMLGTRWTTSRRGKP